MLCVQVPSSLQVRSDRTTYLISRMFLYEPTKMFYPPSLLEREAASEMNEIWVRVFFTRRSSLRNCWRPGFFWLSYLFTVSPWLFAGTREQQHRSFKAVDGQRFGEAVVNLCVQVSALKIHSILNDMKSHELWTFPSFSPWLPSPCWNRQHNFSGWYTRTAYDISRLLTKLLVCQNSSLL